MTFPRIFALYVHRFVSLRDKVLVGWSTDSLRRVPRGGIEQTQRVAFIYLMHDLRLHSFLDWLGWSIDASDSFSVSPARSFIDSGMLFTSGC